jgi:hypothetical protein
MQNITTNGQRPREFAHWLYAGAWRSQCAVLSSCAEVRFVRRSDVLSRHELEALCAHISALFDTEDARLAALMQRAA